MKVYRYEFENELLGMFLSSKNLKDVTIKKKFKVIWQKYFDLKMINYSSESAKEDQNNRYYYQKIAETLLFDRVVYEFGVFKFSEIVYLDVSNTSVIATLKNGKEILMSTNYKYLKDILEKRINTY